MFAAHGVVEQDLLAPGGSRKALLGWLEEQADDDVIALVGHEPDLSELATCLLASCGDGATQAGVEECDDGNQNNSDDCTVACKLPTCMDGIKSGKESDSDCGGGTCNDCNKGKACAADTDCDGL